uniref:Uncharacterized protein n=1 Tax=Arundo donax TaxID=35708 RepID=A0A0A9TQF4_ARUDO
MPYTKLSPRKENAGQPVTQVGRQESLISRNIIQVSTISMELIN